MMMPPNGACLSVANALTQASRRSGSEPTPHGFVCFQNCYGRFREFPDKPRRSVDIEDVVIRELLAMQLLKIVLKMAVQACRLMRVFSVTEAHFQWQREGERSATALFSLKKIGDCPIVFGSRQKSFDRELFPEPPTWFRLDAVRSPSIPCVIDRIGDNRDRSVILGCAPQHRRAADINLFNRLFHFTSGRAIVLSNG